MNTTYHFAFVQTIDSNDLEGTIALVNRTRHHLIVYDRIIRTAPRRGWSALILDATNPDHYLLRHLSERLKTTAFSFGIQGVRLYYRLHQTGRTVSAFESHLTLWITQQLRALLSTGDVMRLDLGEPAGRLVLRRYHEHQRNRAWSNPTPQLDIPPAVEAHYQGQAADLMALFRLGTAVDDVQEALSPGFSPQAALDRLAQALDLPYLAGDRVEVNNPPATDGSQRRFTAHEPQRVVQGYAILKPGTWPEGGNLPEGWGVVWRSSWEETSA